MGGDVEGQTGKLKWAGEAWATGRLFAGTRSPALDDAQLWGIDPEALGLTRSEEEGVWERHASALHAFVAVDTQWRIVMGEKAYWVGLDYAAVKAGLDLAGLSLTPGEWSDVQMIEKGALEALNRK